MIESILYKYTPVLLEQIASYGYLPEVAICYFGALGALGAIYVILINR